MKIGICVGLPNPEAAAGAPDMIRLAAELGYDYVEMPLSSICELDDSRFESVKRKLSGENIKCECMNVFFPAKVRLTGDNYDEAVLNGYLKKALDRANQLGVQVIVLGSGGARNFPEGYPYEKAFAQLTAACKVVSDAASAYNINIAIETLNRSETNIIASMAEADRLVTAVGRPNIKLLVDYYHFMLESDSLDVLQRLLREKKIIHTHFAEPEGRAYPVANNPEYAKVFDILRAEGYNARCSIEARLGNANDPRAEMATGLKAMREIAGA